MSDQSLLWEAIGIIESRIERIENKNKALEKKMKNIENKINSEFFSVH